MTILEALGRYDDVFMVDWLEIRIATLIFTVISMGYYSPENEFPNTNLNKNNNNDS